MQVDSCALLLFLFRKLKWIFPLIFIHYIVNFYVLMCFSHHSPHPHPSSQLINFPITKQITAVCDCDKFTSIYVLLKLYLISVVIWLALLRIMLILLTKIRFVTFNTNLCQLRTTITYDVSFIPPSLTILPLLLCNTDDVIAIFLVCDGRIVVMVLTKYFIIVIKLMIPWYSILTKILKKPNIYDFNNVPLLDILLRGYNDYIAYKNS